ncbi:MAG: nicotinate phosphoribosyltransferase [Candidatus Syntrophonatronum acetioxidans]|uniref:nicotinate phosphoribosyltransferase n=1 Tax=Candidatus Syntrophonatronum acetioxidans TaxID=1795816 RepID=A0A424YC41_9FIRM|nr:MAG: nicotinate phosphoribosyltransferase [Candidatus Syntrophonatronum acetioxidans]
MKPKTSEEILKYKISPQRVLYSATHQEIIEGLTTDVYFLRSREILEKERLDKVRVTAEIFTSKQGILAGVEEALNLLSSLEVEAWALPEGEKMDKKEVVMRIEGAYGEFAVYETALLGLLASSSGWATAARECVEEARGRQVISFGARHIHPAVAPVMERAAIIGGAQGCSCILGAKLLDKEPIGTVPHAAFLVVGDTVKVAETFDEIMPGDVPRIILVDTFKDEAEEALRVAFALKDKLLGVRLDTPGERGGVTPGLVMEVRARLDLEGYKHVKILVSGGITPQRMPELIEGGADSFGVGSYIARASAIDMTMDLKEIEGRPLAKRGRIPGKTENPRLKKVL